MSQTIKIKRSTGSSAPSTLENGELAYLNNSTTKKLYIGRPGGGTGDIDVIGGKDFTDKADAALARTGGAMTGAITTNSTFDGRDVATDGTKLDGIEAGADVTDATNVAAAGALMLTGGTLTSDLVLGDNNKVQFGGTTTNLEIYNDGTTSYIKENASGDLEIHATDFTIKDGGGQTMMSFDADGVLRLYDQQTTNPVEKLKTQTTGIYVNGTMNSTGIKLGNETVIIDSIKDEDNMSSNSDPSGSATALATQQSIKAYVDSNPVNALTSETFSSSSAGNFTFSGDTVKTSGSTMTLDPSTDGAGGTVKIEGNLTVTGTTTTINSNTVSVGDSIIQLNTDLPHSTTAADGGIEVYRGQVGGDGTDERSHANIIWDESASKWTVDQATGTASAMLTAANWGSEYSGVVDGGSF